MTVLSIDIETYSDQELGSVGVYRYADSPSFSILLFGYSIDGGPVEVVDLTREALPDEILAMLTDETVTKSAFNAQFERVCINRFFEIRSGPWECSMVKAWYCGMSGGLAAVGSALGLSEDEGKIKDGKKLIKIFCQPPAESYMGPLWEDFIAYCRRDVEVELEIRRRLAGFTVPQEEQEVYRLDQVINDRGIRLDMDLVKGAIHLDEAQAKEMATKYKALTGLDNPNSLKDIKAFIRSRTGTGVQSITKGNLDELIEKYQNFPEVVGVLEIRKALSRTSTAKYDKMDKVVMADGRARGIFQYYGASRTGRWAGRLIQAQNLPRNYIRDLDTARALIKAGDPEAFAMAYDDVPDIMSQCLRTAIIPSEGCVFAVADYSAIEARVVAWLAGEEWVLEVFRTSGKIYEATAGRMLHVPLESIHKGSALRQRGKVATLALGYQGSVGALKAMGALNMGIPEEDLQELVDQWRQANPRIVEFWSETQRAVQLAIMEGGTVTFGRGRLKAKLAGGILWIQLPGGRRLAYAKPRLSENQWGGPAIAYADRSSTGGGKWIPRKTYGGSLVENIVQAVARDLLAHAMLALEAEGYPIVMHIHDEVVVELPKDRAGELDRICSIMGQAPEWAEGLPLTADGYICEYYQKD